jgi:hypothetical protein
VTPPGYGVCQHRCAVKTAILLTLAVLLAGTATAQAAELGLYDPCPAAGDAKFVEVSRATCAEAGAVAVAVSGQPPANVEAAVRAAGWTPLRVFANDFELSHDLVAIRGLAALRIRRRGEAPDLDGWMSGRELLFSRETLVGGAPPPEDSTLCTTAFIVRLGKRFGGLSAAHCAGTTKAGKTRRRFAALRRAPQPGIVLGSVRRNLARRARPIDVLALPLPSGPGRPSAAVVERFIWRPPWFVTGRARPLRGRSVCFAGRSSGPDNCGKIIRTFPGARGLRCTDIQAQEGDSGAPVYTAPRADGTVRAVGIANVVVGLFSTMCFVPLSTALDALGATVVTTGG